MEIYEEHKTPVLAVEEVRQEQVGHYGIVEGVPMGTRQFRVHRLVEKPHPGETDSTLAIAGRYILTPDVFEALEATKPGRNDEIQLTDALAAMLGEKSMVAVSIEGRRFDIGNKRDYLRTVLAYALKREEFADVVREALLSLDGASEKDEP